MLRVVTNTLDDGVIGTMYGEVLEATGGDGSYTWSLTEGDLPPGVDLTPDGALEGNPTAGGRWLFTVQVESGDGQRAVSELSVFVRSATPVLIAFIGDQGYEEPSRTDGPRAVLTLIRNEGAELVLHQGDFDYMDDPDLWFSQMNDILGPDFPYLASIGNHDAARWDEADGYRARLEARALGHGITWTGEYGEAASVVFRGIRILLAAPGVLGDDPDVYADYLSGELAAATEDWRICSWHKNQSEMQVGKKPDETGWGVYEACRAGGAIVATGHEHSYSRTHLLSNITNQTVASTADTLAVEPGETFVFVNGLGGASIRGQARSGPWWASIYTGNQGAKFGALFGLFNAGGVPGFAHFYFKNIDGGIVDEFWVRVPSQP